MKKIYYKDADGNKVIFEVTDEVAAAYKEERQKMWREEAYHAYYTTSLDKFVEAGHDFRDMDFNAEEREIANEMANERNEQIQKLRIAYGKLTGTQKRTLYKLFVKNMSQADIARDEGVSEQAVSDRIIHLYARIRKLIKKFS